MGQLPCAPRQEALKYGPEHALLALLIWHKVRSSLTESHQFALA